MSSDPMMPIGMSFCGFFASCAAVLTASNPMYAKNTIAAPVMTPLQPYSPGPSLGGMNGFQFAEWTACAAPKMKSSTTASFTNTMTLLTFADSLMPTTRSVVMIAMMMTAGRLKTAVAVVPSAHVTSVPRAADRAHGKSKCRAGRRDDTTEPDQPIPTVTAPGAYSSTRAHPTIQAMSSPNVVSPQA